MENLIEKQKVIELMKPRWKVIADYPKSLYNVGDILNGGWRSEDLIYCDTEGPRWSHYPHLFQKLEWWQDRKIEDMPEYVKFEDKILKVESHYTSSFNPPTHTKYGCRIHSDFYSYEKLLPATLAEYQSYIQSKE